MMMNLDFYKLTFFAKMGLLFFVDIEICLVNNTYRRNCRHGLEKSVCDAPVSSNLMETTWSYVQNIEKGLGFWQISG